jgi:hypothetical protein
LQGTLFEMMSEGPAGMGTWSDPNGELSIDGIGVIGGVIDGSVSGHDLVIGAGSSSGKVSAKSHK